MVTVILDSQKNLTSTQSSENSTNQINELYSKEILRTRIHTPFIKKKIL
jgi:hypothetical protein